jgi:hypothetical protein
MKSSFSVQCMMCGRSSGQVRGGVFLRTPSAPPLQIKGGKSVCGFCGGNLFLEPDDSLAANVPQLDRADTRLRRVS